MTRQAAATDVLILGGGPAGAAAAIACADAGLSVVLLERSPRARAKVGEALHPGVEPLLAGIGLGGRLPEVCGARFAGVRVGWGEPPTLQPFGGDAAGPWLGYQIRRAEFETLLLTHAASRGAEIRRGVGARTLLEDGGRVTGVVAEDGERLPAAVVIDATGPARWLSRALGLAWQRRSPALTVRYGYARGERGDDAAPELIADDAGWSWTARVADGLHHWARLDLPGAPPSPPIGLPGLRTVGPSRGADATWRIAQRTAGPGWFLAGEAAASVDPTSSKGVLKALTSGLFAGRTAAAMLARGAPAEPGRAAYDRWLRRGFEAEVATLATLYARLGAVGFGDLAREAARRPSLAADA